MVKLLRGSCHPLQARMAIEARSPPTTSHKCGDLGPWHTWERWDLSASENVGLKCAHRAQATKCPEKVNSRDGKRDVLVFCQELLSLSRMCLSIHLKKTIELLKIRGCLTERHPERGFLQFQLIAQTGRAHTLRWFN